MKKLIISGMLLLGTLSTVAQDIAIKTRDTIVVTIDQLLRKTEIDIKEGQVIEFKTKNQEKLIKSRVHFRFWQNEEVESGQTTAFLYSKGTIVFGNKTTNENIHVTSPISGILEVKIRSYGLIWAGILTGAIVYIGLVFM